MAKFRMYPLLRANNVLELYRQLPVIDLDPPYQRLSVWDLEKQQRFIDSVINGVDTPKLYFHDVSRNEGKPLQYRFSVIDGKQRLLALQAFIQNKIALPADFIYYDNEAYKAAELTYSQLLSDYPLLRARFDGYSVPVVVVDATDDEIIEELFWRLNIQVPLSAPERRNAFGGPLPLLIRKIARTPFFRESVSLNNKRYQHLDLAAKFLYICHADGVVDTKKAILDSFVNNFKRARKKHEDLASPELLARLEERTMHVLQQEHEFFGVANSLLSSVSRNTLYFHVFRRCNALNSCVPFTLEMLEAFNAHVTMARRKSQSRLEGSDEALEEWENELVWFDREKQSPNDRGAIERQYRYFANYLRAQCHVELPELS